MKFTYRLLMSVSFFLLMARGSLFSQVPTAGLVAWYSFNGTVNDSSGNGNDGTATSLTPTADRFNRQEGAYQFDGSTSEVLLPNNFQTHSQTICAWYYVAQAGNDRAVFMEYRDNSNRLKFGQQYTNSDFYGYMENGGTAQWSAVSPAGTSLLNTWNFACLVMDASSDSASLFVNNSLQAKVKMNGYDPTTIGTLTKTGIGHAYDVSTDHFIGNLDDIRIYNRALTASEVNQLYHEGGYDPSLVAYFPFNGDVRDATGNGHDGVSHDAVPAMDRFGNTGQAYAFNGSTSYIDVGNLGAINDATYSIWIRPSSLASSAMLFGSYGSNNAVFFLRYNDSAFPAKKLDYLIAPLTENGRWGYGDCSNLDDAWHHVVFTRTNSTVGLFVDGSPVSVVQTLSQGTADGAINNGLNMYLGAVAGSTSPYAFNFFTGLLDDVRIYNRVLRLSEIDSLYHLGGWPLGGPRQYTIRELNEVPLDSLLLMDTQQSLASFTLDDAYPARNTDTVAVVGVVTVKPRIITNTLARYDVYIQDTTTGQIFAGLNVITNDTSSAAQSTGIGNVDTGQVIRVVGRAFEYGPAPNSLTAIYPYSATTPLFMSPQPIQILTTGSRPAPRECTVDSFATGATPLPSRGEKYEGMYVVIRNVTVIGNDLTTGRFTFADAKGNQMQTFDGSGYYTLRGHKISGSTYAPPPIGTILDYIRGVIIPISKTGTAGQYCIMPLYPGPNELHGSSYAGDIRISPLSPNVKWRYQLKAAAGAAIDGDNYLGVASSATDGFDSLYDIPKSPAPVGNYVQLYFPHPEYNLATGDNFAQDIHADRAIGDTTVRWHFEVKTNFDTTVSIEVVPDGNLPPKIKTLLRDVTGGIRAFLTPGSMIYTFRSGAGTNLRKFEILIGDSLAPSVLVLKPNGGEIIRSRKNYNLSYFAADKSGIDSIRLLFSTNGGTTYTNLTTIPGNLSSYNWNVPSQYLSYQGSVKIVATDSMGNSASNASARVFTIVGDSLAKSFSAGWSLTGLPLKPADSTAAAVFGDDLSQQFYMFDYNSSIGYLRSSILGSGRGYWLGLLSNATLDVTGVPYTDSISIPLTKGWNIISNPLAVPILKDSLTVRQSGVTKTYGDAMSAGWIAAGLQTYQPNSYFSQDTLALWNGYWISALQDNVSLVFIPPAIGTIPAQSAAEKTKIANPLDWQVSIVASYAGTSDQTLRFGVKADATAGFDPKYDEPKAPAPPAAKFVESYFNYPSWAPVLGAKFNADIRNPNSALNWNFAVAPSDSGLVNLTWSVPASVPDSIHLQLIDGTTTIDMKRQSSYSFAAKLPRGLRVNSIVTSVNDNSRLPTTYALEQNFPNPFNPSTTIQYALPHDGRVTIIVYNVLGQEIAKLANDEMKAGYHTALWTANVASGVYFYRIEASALDDPTNQFIQVRKMLLLK